MYNPSAFRPARMTAVPRPQALSVAHCKATHSKPNQTVDIEQPRIQSTTELCTLLENVVLLINLSHCCQ